MSKGRKLKIRSDSEDDRAREREKDYMTPTSTIQSQGYDETPSLEKHGFWLYPSNSYENIDGCRQNDDGPPSLEEPSQKTSQKQAFTCGCCCCCPCHSMFPSQQMAFPQPMAYPGSFPNFAKKTEPRRFNQTERKKSKDRQMRNQGLAVRSDMEEIVAIDGMRDMDMASMVINDAKTNFNKALMEDYPKSPPDRTPSGAEEVGPKGSKEQTEDPLQNDNVDEIFELGAMKDMEMASMILNDSRAIFNQAVDEEKPKKTVTRKDDIPARERRPKENEDKPRESMQGSAMEDKLEVDAMKDMEMASMVINDARSNFNKAVDEEKPKTSPYKKRRVRSKRDSKGGKFGEERDKKVSENRQPEDGKAKSKAEKDSKKGQFEKEPSKNTKEETKSEAVVHFCFKEKEVDNRGGEKTSTESSTTMTDKSKICNKKSFQVKEEENKKSTKKTSSQQKSQQKRLSRRKKSKKLFAKSE